MLAVAHRLAVAQEPDRILVMDAGQIVESGRPEELIRRGGQFAALLDLEAAGWDWQTDGRAHFGSAFRQCYLHPRCMSNKETWVIYLTRIFICGKLLL